MSDVTPEAAAADPAAHWGPEEIIKTFADRIQEVVNPLFKRVEVAENKLRELASLPDRVAELELAVSSARSVATSASDAPAEEPPAVLAPVPAEETAAQTEELPATVDPTATPAMTNPVEPAA